MRGSDRGGPPDLARAGLLQRDAGGAQRAAIGLPGSDLDARQRPERHTHVHGSGRAVDDHGRGQRLDRRPPQPPPPSRRTEAPLVRMSSTSTIRSSPCTGQPRRSAALPGSDRLGEDAAHRVAEAVLQVARRLEGEQHAAGGGTDHQRRVVGAKRLGQAAADLDGQRSGTAGPRTSPGSGRSGGRSSARSGRAAGRRRPRTCPRPRRRGDRPGRRPRPRRGYS